jgi:acetoin utilization deacetylase AcuC-like enzyme
MQSVATGFVYDDKYLLHDAGPEHPEQPERLSAIVRRLDATGLMARLKRLQPQPVEGKWLTTVHDADYVARVEAACFNAPTFVDSMDTLVCNRSYEVARLAAGGVLVAVDAVVTGEVRNAFCAARPGGHHALPDRSMGFCLFNHVAIAARYAQMQHQLERILIVDLDVHHGNGTQAIFYDDPTVLFFDIHQDHFYPHTGAVAERGLGRGIGFTINVPLEAGLGNDQYKVAFRDKLLPPVKEFRPNLLLLSAGFDAYKYDTLGRMKVTPRGFAEMTRVLKAIAKEHCHNRLIAVLEGGYNAEGLAECVEAHVRALMGMDEQGTERGGAD